MTSKILLVLIILVASFARLYQLGSVPPSPDWDEAALGYNAWSMLQTGRDEYGKFLPFILRSFDDYKPALYMYSIIPLLPLFGLDMVSVRLPSAIFGILSVLAVYFLMKELFQRKDISLLASFLFAISPISIQFSRVAFETNTAAAFNIFGALFFLKGLKNPRLLLLSALFLGLNPSIYQSVRVFTPLLTICLIAIFWKKLIISPKKYLILAFMVGILALLPLIINIATDSRSLYRLKGVSILSDPTNIKNQTQRRYLDDKTENYPTASIFHNKRVSDVREILSGYLSHFDFNWLFIKGDIARHHAPSVGILYLWELPFFLAGIYSLLFHKYPHKTKIFIFSWYLLAPIPAAVTTGLPHIVRTLNFLPTFQIFTALGLLSFIIWSSNLKFSIIKIRIKYIFFTLIFSFFIFNFTYYINQYFVQLNYFTSEDWQYGYKETVSYVKSVEKEYNKIVVSDRSPLDQSHMFFLFYLKYPPSDYQKAGNASGGFEENHKFDKYEFRPIDWKNEQKNPKILYIGRPGDFEGGANIKKTIYYLNGKPAIIIVEG